ncbi:PREDICTED: uncharacterized protein LOC104776257 [Camelina sativa]|uniref:Uncharacterized protein LOC104776257 n=1 Tax=Camelina sativa TaxID=90675 RepID=A0ABM0YBM5_CAMSA|nr:PREDICTED: uncharacterized protein LOC104776257 [Camelina sativa]
MLDPSSAKSSDTHLCFPSIPNDHSDSGVSSPTLWRNSPPRSPFHRPEDYWSLSPDSKAQAIARGQRELMEMVSKMPESCYELSLKDLVEVKVNQENERKVFDELPEREDKPSKVVKKTKSDKRIDPNRSGGGFDGGFLLKMMFPVSLGGKTNTTKKKTKKKKKKGEDTIKDSQVSPRPSICDELVREEDKEWWNKMSELSTKRSGSSSSNSSNSLRGGKRSCLSFLWKVPSKE